MTFLVNNLIRKVKLISEFMTSLTGKQIITVHILLNITRNKVHQTMKFSQLIKYNVTNTFLINHTKNVVLKLVPDSFPKIQNYAYLWIKILKSRQIEYYRIILKLRC